MSIHFANKKAGGFLAQVFGQPPRHEIREALRHFEQLMETGEISTIEGWTSGRRIKCRTVVELGKLLHFESFAE